jgi:hypothetical protein
MNIELIGSGNTIRIADDNREDALDKMIAVLEPWGLCTIRLLGESLGRLEMIDRDSMAAFIIFVQAQESHTSSNSWYRL